MASASPRASQIAVLDEGQLVDLGTHEELTERCPLYRLLLAGPGEDAEGVDAGGLAFYENDGRQRDLAARRAPAAGQITPSLWPEMPPADGERDFAVAVGRNNAKPIRS